MTVFGGTDDGEWWRGYDEVAPAIRAQLEASGGFDVTVASPRAFGDGSLSVFEDLPVMKTPDGQSFTARLTGAARLEDGQWRIVQLHLSLGTPNEEIGLQDLPV